MSATEAVALWQNTPNDEQPELHVMAVSPLYAKYNTSVDTAPAPNTKYVITYLFSSKSKISIGIYWLNKQLF